MHSLNDRTHPQEEFVILSTSAIARAIHRENPSGHAQIALLHATRPILKQLVSVQFRPEYKAEARIDPKAIDYMVNSLKICKNTAKCCNTALLYS